MTLTSGRGADVLALLKDIAFGSPGLRTSARHDLNRVAIVLDGFGGQDLATFATTG